MTTLERLKKIREQQLMIREQQTEQLEELAKMKGELAKLAKRGEEIKNTLNQLRQDHGLSTI